MQKAKVRIALLCAICGCILLMSACVSNHEYIVENDRAIMNVDKDKLKGLHTINPFDGLIVSFEGISPYCSVYFNTSNCSTYVQENVRFSLKSDRYETEGYFAIGDEISVYAILSENNTDTKASTIPEYAFQENSKVYTVEDVPEYITELTDGMDLSLLETQLNDKLDSILAFSAGQSLENWGIGRGSFIITPENYKSHTSPIAGDRYFSALKRNAYTQYPDDADWFNRVDFLYSITITAENDEAYTRYFTICAKNLIKHPDNTIAWGEDNPDTLALDMQWSVDSTSMNSLINSQITSKKENYNITSVNGFFS